MIVHENGQFIMTPKKNITMTLNPRDIARVDDEYSVKTANNGREWLIGFGKLQITTVDGTKTLFRWVEDASEVRKEINKILSLHQSS
jgi:hypothetical protein